MPPRLVIASCAPGILFKVFSTLLLDLRVMLKSVYVCFSDLGC